MRTNSLPETPEIMKYEVRESRNAPGDWHVEAIDYANDGVIFMAVFSGPNARERAEEYMHWKSSQFAS